MAWELTIASFFIKTYSRGSIVKKKNASSGPDLLSLLAVRFNVPEVPLQNDVEVQMSQLKRKTTAFIKLLIQTLR